MGDRNISAGHYRSLSRIVILSVRYKLFRNAYLVRCKFGCPKPSNIAAFQTLVNFLIQELPNQWAIYGLSILQTNYSRWNTKRVPLKRRAFQYSDIAVRGLRMHPIAASRRNNFCIGPHELL